MAKEAGVRMVDNPHYSLILDSTDITSPSNSTTQQANMREKEKDDYTVVSASLTEQKERKEKKIHGSLNNPK